MFVGREIDTFPPHYCFSCHPTIAGDSTNIFLNFTLHDAHAIDTYPPHSLVFRFSIRRPPPVSFPPCFSGQGLLGPGEKPAVDPQVLQPVRHDTPQSYSLVSVSRFLSSSTVRFLGIGIGQIGE